MGHHIDADGRFQSDKHPDLAPDKIVLSFKDPLARRALYALAFNYKDVDPGLTADIYRRLATLYPDPVKLCDEAQPLPEPPGDAG